MTLPGALFLSLSLPRGRIDCLPVLFQGDNSRQSRPSVPCVWPAGALTVHMSSPSARGRAGGPVVCSVSQHQCQRQGCGGGRRRQSPLADGRVLLPPAEQGGPARSLGKRAAPGALRVTHTRERVPRGYPNGGQGVRAASAVDSARWAGVCGSWQPRDPAPRGLQRRDSDSFCAQIYSHPHRPESPLSFLPSRVTVVSATFSPSFLPL